MYNVSKIVISLHEAGETYYLLSGKQKPGQRDHGRLEFLGGRHDPSESARDALLRELQEEEASGLLYRLALQGLITGPEFVAGDAHHFMFKLAITAEDFEHLSADPAESLGFFLVLGERLRPGDEYTGKTNLILASLAELGELTG